MLSSAQNELDIIYNFYKELNKRKYNYGNDTMMNSQTISRVLGYFLIDYYEKNKTPVVLRDSEYERLKNTTLFHGFRSLEHAANYIWDYMYHYGEGVLGTGIYTSSSKDEALHYTRCGDDIANDRVLEMKLLTDNIVNYSVTRDAIYNITGREFKGSVPYPDLPLDKNLRYEELKAYFKEKNDPEFTNAFLSNYSNIGIYLGFDGVFREGGDKRNSTHYIIFNRGSLAVSESSASNILSNAGEKYSGFSFVFEDEK